MVDRGMHLVIIGKDQIYTDLPENSNTRNPNYLNERVRGTGGFRTIFGEENLLSLHIDRYDDEIIAVHEFCHLIATRETLMEYDPGLLDFMEETMTYKGKVDWRYQK